MTLEARKGSDGEGKTAGICLMKTLSVIENFLKSSTNVKINCFEIFDFSSKF